MEISVLNSSMIYCIYMENKFKKEEENDDV